MACSILLSMARRLLLETLQRHRQVRVRRVSVGQVKVRRVTVTSESWMGECDR